MEPVAVCAVPVCSLRAEPGHRYEIVTQMLFGEGCKVMESGPDGWVKVMVAYDGYEGWCPISQLEYVGPQTTQEVGLTIGWVNTLTFDGRRMHVPLGSSLPGLHEGVGVWGKHHLRYEGEVWNPLKHQAQPHALLEIAYMYLNTPYLWGGKSVFGIDCSGFSQSVFRFFHIPLLRDAAQQATQGEGIGFLQEARAGDLAFFDNPEGRITHVGILLGDQEIIHASGKVRIDKIDNLGIINVDTGRRTHQLRIIKRMW